MNDLDRATDRAYRAIYREPPERDTYRWASLRLDIANRRLARAIVRSFVRPMQAMSATADSLSQSMLRLGDALRKR